MSTIIPTSCQRHNTKSPSTSSVSCLYSSSPDKTQSRSPLVKGSIVMLLTALVDMLTAFSTAYWATWTRKDGGEGGGGSRVRDRRDLDMHTGGYGLWKIWSCPPGVESLGQLGSMFHLWENVNEGECSVKMADSSFPGWYVGVQVLQTVGLAGVLTASVLLLLYVFWPRWHRNKRALSAVIGVSYTSGLFMMVGLFLFGFKVAEDIQESGTKDWALSWSFSLACISFILNQIAASVLISENKSLTWNNHSSDCSPCSTRESNNDSVTLFLPKPDLTSEQELEENFEHYMRKKKKIII